MNLRGLCAAAVIVACVGMLSAGAPAAEPSPLAGQLSPEQIAAGWIELFDGETLFGWQPTGEANWRVEEGELRVDAGEPGWLMTHTEWADYRLHVEFKAPAATNSGVFVRSVERPTDPQRDCVEVNIAPQDDPFPTPSLVGRQRIDLSDGGKIKRSTDTAYRNVARLDAWDGQWHALDIVVAGETVEVQFDGVTPNVFFSEEENYGAVIGKVPPRGRIGLQFNEGEIAFRNIRLQPRGLEPIFNGENLDGWNTDQAQASEFSVTEEGELRIVNGRGQIESDAVYGDFVLRLECFVNGDALNSGVFFRSIPRDFTNGYESQIQNAVVDGDPARPVDCGTGGIYRRIDARRVNARDRQWFSKTIVATGPHIAVWVNGYPVTAWTDDRAPHDNPRQGLRTAPGTLSLQGHDPTTDIRFRNLQIQELPPLSTGE